jgi:histidinol-phosphate aminotransferase
VSRFRRASLEGFAPYVPGFQPRDGEDWLKLNTNESPLEPSPHVRAAIEAAASQLRLYPDPTQEELREALAAAHGLHPYQVIAGNGADEVLAMAVRAFVARGAKAAFLTPSYSYIAAILATNDVDGEAHEFNAGFQLPAGFISSTAALKFVTNPNSPSGTLLPLGDIAELCAASAGVVLVDEAYVDFAPRNAVELLDDHPNLLLVRTMSKSYALAGLRIGFALAARDVIADLATVKDSYNLGRLQLAAATAAVRDSAHWQAAVEQTIANRESLSGALRDRGWEVLPSAANFIFAIPTRPAREVYEALLDQRVLVRYFDKPGIDHGLRISIGTSTDSGRLLAALDTIA